MAESVLEPPQSSSLPPRLEPFKFTEERARLAGQRSGEARRAQAVAKANADKPPTPDTVQLQVNAQLELVTEAITHMRQALKEDMEPHHRAQLVRSYLAAMETQRKLLGIHDPGPSKAPAAPRQARSAVESSLPEPTPVAVSAPQ